MTMELGRVNDPLLVLPWAIQQTSRPWRWVRGSLTVDGGSDRGPFAKASLTGVEAKAIMRRHYAWPGSVSGHTPSTPITDIIQ